MQYEAIYLDEKKTFIARQTIDMRFIVIDKATNVPITDFSSGYIIRFSAYNGSHELKADSDGDNGGITTSGAIITVQLNPTNSIVLDANTYYDTEMQLEIGSAVYTCYRDKIFIEEEVIDWT